MSTQEYPFKTVTQATLVSGENQATNRQEVSNPKVYEPVTLSATADVVVGTTGAPGDVLAGIHFNTAPGEDVIVRDGTTDRFTIPNAAAVAGYTWEPPGGEVMCAEFWALKDTTTATDTVIVVGRFT